jgi:hypothetical protein
MPDTTTSLTTTDAPFQLIATTGADSPLAIVEVNLGGQPLKIEKLPKVTIPGGEGRQWIVRGLRGDERHDELVGVIVHQQASRTYYAEAYTGGGAPPECSSNDGISGYPGIDGTSCIACPMNEWGTANSGKGKGCSEYQNLYLLGSLKALPVVIRISPGSLGALDSFMQQLSAEMLRRDRVVIAIGLEDGGGYSRASFRLVRELDADEASDMRQYVEHFGNLVTGVPNTDIVIDQGVEPAYGDDEPPPPSTAPDDEMPFE